MAIFKRTYGSGRVVWCYVFDAPWAKESREQLKGSGFETKREAQDAETKRRVEAAQEHQARLTGALAPTPKTLRDLLKEYFAQCGRGLAAKTLERYQELSALLSEEILGAKLLEISPLHLSREWNRLLATGGRDRKTKAARALKPKTVRAVCSVVSCAFTHAISWGVAVSNPVAASDPPVFREKKGSALTPAQQRLIIDSAHSPWGMAAFLELDAATGVRRGELLALRWSDVRDGRILHIARSLSQTKGGLAFKETKEDVVNNIALPASAADALARHRQAQEVYRQQFGPDYRTDLDLVFCGFDGSPLKPDSVSAAVSNHFRKLKFTGKSLHTLRHTHGSHLLAAGVPLPEVSKRLGHKSVYTTAKVYSHALPGRDEEAAAAWEEFQKTGRVTVGSRHRVLEAESEEKRKPDGTKYQ